MKLSFFKIIIFLLFFSSLAAQKSYSYVSDRKFKDPTDLIGYNFRPSELELPDTKTEQKLRPGAYSFGISQTNLYVRGKGIEGVYNMNTINTTDYGFFIKMINARDARIQGHLKIILTKNDQVDALLFRRSEQEEEMVFFLKIMDEEKRAKEKAHFTDLNEMVVENPDSLWGRKIYPFLRLEPERGLQERINVSDSAYIQFEKVVNVNIKTKEKKVKEKIEVDGEKVTIDTVLIERDTTITMDYTVTLHEFLLYNDGTIKTNKEVYIIKKFKEREDEMAEAAEEKFRIDLETKKGETLYLYLLGDRTFSSFELEGRRYLARGY